MSSNVTFSLLFNTVLPVKSYMAFLAETASAQISNIKNWRQPQPMMMMKPLRKPASTQQEQHSNDQNNGSSCNF